MCTRVRLPVRHMSTSPGTLVVGRHAPHQAQLRDQRGLPRPPPAAGCSVPNLLLQRCPTGGLRRDGLHGVLPSRRLLQLLRMVFRCLFLFLFLGPLLGKRQPQVKRTCWNFISEHSLQGQRDLDANPAPLNQLCALRQVTKPPDLSVPRFSHLQNEDNHRKLLPGLMNRGDAWKALIRVCGPEKELKKHELLM